MKEQPNLDEKELLELEKLELEIKNLKKVWWKQPSYASIILPAIFTLFSLIYAISSGFFDRRYERFKLEKETLRLEVLKFEEERNKVLSQRDSALNVANNLKITTKLLRNKLAEMDPSFASIEYDNIGNITKLTDLSGNSTIYTYDDLNRLTEIALSPIDFSMFEYDKSNRVIELQNLNGEIIEIEYEYDSNGNLITKIR